MTVVSLVSFGSAYIRTNVYAQSAYTYIWGSHFGSGRPFSNFSAIPAPELLGTGRSSGKDRQTTRAINRSLVSTSFADLSFSSSPPPSPHRGIKRKTPRELRASGSALLMLLLLLLLLRPALPLRAGTTAATPGEGNFTSF